MLKYAFAVSGFTILTIGSSGAVQAETVHFAVQPSEANATATPYPIESSIIAQSFDPLASDTNGRSRFSIGVSGNIGITGDTAMGESSVSINSKIGLTDSLSVRPSVGLNSDPSITVPLTVDFPTGADTDIEDSVTPYIGGGVVITTGDNGQVAPMATVGLDVPIADAVGASTSVDAGFLETTQVGASVGLSYSF
ncbi:hypothetical protein IQ230_22630 [Gloeocapsopsis crepidinum LEGE 06123]|uniref:Outer membrane protein beta-barrel domain-containing protein n=1 Tax=Gloeocapsopsis crepidinum LEGE 06123 TaxID=588587 RepID=A0ABR9UXR3_9CHRO|nr:hypothetical protein [Gloeocapsopsis crepidinum]MBE9193096.1 hypothetical protein [Gloeocapsopsis crepidinum LEGE 06123]